MSEVPAPIGQTLKKQQNLEINDSNMESAVKDRLLHYAN